MFQQVLLVGNLGQDPTPKFLADGTPVTTFSMATSRKWVDKEGNAQERTVWWRVTAFGRLAETTNTFLSKGKKALVIGEVQEPKPYQAKDGTWKASLDVTASTVRFLSAKSETTTETATTTEQTSKEADPFGESIPF